MSFRNVTLHHCTSHIFHVIVLLADHNECACGHHTCEEEDICLNTEGSFVCISKLNNSLRDT